MKHTKVMLAGIGTFLCTWFLLSLLGMLLSDLSFRETATSNGTVMFMLILGWVPSIVVACDVASHLDEGL